jgi:hypothetical protein
MNRQSTLRNRLRLLAVVSVVLGLFLVVLPAVGRWSVVRDRIRRNEAAGINPTAIYYTEHPAIGLVNISIAEKIAKEPAAFGFTSPELRNREETR